VYAVNVYLVRTGFNGFAGGKFAPDSALVEHGKDTTFTITPLTGYRLLALTDNGKAVATFGKSSGLDARTYTVKGVTGNHLLEASFKRIYTLTAGVTGNGTISPLGTMVVDSGATQAFAMASGSPATGIIVSSLVDNEKNLIADVTGDPMNASAYTLASINSDHVINAVFTVKTFIIKASGVNLCIRSADCLIQKCKLCLDGINSDTLTVQYNSKWLISTDSVNTVGGKFTRWNKDGTAFATVRAITTDPVLADVTYSASYGKIIVIDPCIPKCVIIDPPILLPIGSTATPIPIEGSVTPAVQAKETAN
jgi:hypothetical protein